MSAQEQMLDLLRLEIDSLSNYAAVQYGPLPDANSIVLIPSEGEPQECTLGHGGTYTMEVALNGKHTSQSTVSETLFKIHEHLNKISYYPSGINWTLIALTTLAAPHYAEHDEQYWVYESKLVFHYVID